ncbi:hypothetical protein [Flavihumibacter petaseus]|uniref:SGNH hydrolase-type esterase domain-containing protein n=1 Tax=Flavihumibacter petaseus NBRC 106054 TaxID=1220578 RepID=A0A0E9N7B1_9BACT|nr:hypothetical protein [Flavihumibacter petaseus]GAO45235.1 hypothetical protein FPE01S_04_04790 [Flavihumibacter petaseus NBRC 106054]
MILKSIITALLGLTIYNIVVIQFFPNVKVSRHYWQENQIKAQTYVFGNSTPDQVIVGSSLSARLNDKNLPGYGKLSFIGQTVFEGFRVILQRKDLPAKIFVETNYLLRPLSPDFNSSLENPVLFYARSKMEGLRDEKQPLAIVSNKLDNLVKPVVNALARSQAPGTKPSETNPHFENALNNNIEASNRIVDSNEVEQRFALLKTYVDRFVGRGAEVIFFEMPVHPKVAACTIPKAIRKKMKEYFPPTVYKYIEQPDCTPYQTTDGIHLQLGEADTYAVYFTAMRDRIFSGLAKEK